MQRSLNTYKKIIISYRHRINNRQWFSLFMLLITIDQSNNSLVFFVFFAVFFFSFFSQIWQWGLFAAVLYLIYFLFQIFWGAGESVAILAMASYYSMICTLLLLALTPSFLSDIQKNIDKSWIFSSRNTLKNHYQKSELLQIILLIIQIALCLVFVSWFAIDIYKSFLWRSLVWDSLLSLGLFAISLRFLSLHPLLCHWLHRYKHD